MDVSMEPARAGRPGTLMLHLLGRCNLKCLHCYMEGSPTRRERLPIDWVLSAVAECQSLDVGALYLTGGEPLLYRGLKDVIDAAARVEGLEVTLCTNGTLVSEAQAAFLGARGVKANISIDGDAAYHDRFRQRSGAFRSSERGIRRLAGAGVFVTVVATITAGNLHLLTDLVEWASAVGARQFRVQPLLRLGRGIAIGDQCLAGAQMDRLLLRLSDLANLYRARGLRCSLVGVTRKFLLAHPCGAYVCNGAGCHRRVAKEIKKLVVREDGTILPEVTNLSRDFALGTIDDGPLSTMVSRYFDDGYANFDRLCRTTYAELLPRWEGAVVPWDQILAERSRTWRPQPDVAPPEVGCGACVPTSAAAPRAHPNAFTHEACAAAPS